MEWLTTETDSYTEECLSLVELSCDGHNSQAPNFPQVLLRAPPKLLPDSTAHLACVVQ